MGRFASTVAYYENARPPYGAAFFAAVAEKLGLDRNQRLLDVGAGPGMLALGFRPYCRQVVGVDPEPGMVEAARAAAERSGLTATFIEGRFEDAATKLGAFDLVTIGRAIHWLDREAARASLDRALAPRGICRREDRFAAAAAPVVSPPALQNDAAFSPPGCGAACACAGAAAAASRASL